MGSAAASEKFISLFILMDCHFGEYRQILDINFDLISWFLDIINQFVLQFTKVFELISWCIQSNRKLELISEVQILTLIHFSS